MNPWPTQHQHQKVSFTNDNDNDDGDLIRRSANANYSLYRCDDDDYDASPKSPPLTSSSPPPPLPLRKGSLSSHASDMGMKLALERSKNTQLLSRIRELELEEKMPKLKGDNQKSSSRYHHHHDETTNYKHDHSYHDDDDIVGDGGSATFFSSSPVTTPTRPGMKIMPTTKSPTYDKKYKDENNDYDHDGYYFNQQSGVKNHHALHEQNLQEVLQMETQRREAAEQEVKNLLFMIQSKDNCTSDTNRVTSNVEISKYDLKCIDELLDRATSLLAKESSSNNNDGPSEEEDNEENEMYNQMQEYHELATAFYNEQKDHSELDGEEFVPREDIVWLLHELKWRYEEILKKYVLSRGKRRNSPSSFDVCEEWKECVRDFVAVMKKVTNCFSPIRNDNYGQLNGDDSNISSTIDDEKRSGQTSYNLNHQSIEETRSNYQSVDTIKEAYRKQIENLVQLVSDLESKLIEQEESQRNLQRSIEEERQNLALSTEGTSARIRYLEGMVHSLEMELKKSRAVNSFPTHDAAMPLSPPSRPVFMRDLTSDLMQDAEISTQDAVTVDLDDIIDLRNQITCLGNSLAESENERAILIDDFQKERLNYMIQFEQMSELLKQFTGGSECNHTT